MITLVRCLRSAVRSYSTKVKTDQYGIPVNPCWSVTELITSYPRPNVSAKTLTRLHELSALELGPEGSIEHHVLQEELSELVRLVEAVKLVDTQGVQVIPRWDKEDADRLNSGENVDEVHGQLLLQQASRTKDSFYLVASDRTRKQS